MDDAVTIGRTQQDVGGRLVLVVDDDVRTRSYIKAVLQGADVQVLEASDGLEALEVFRVWRGKIDLVITDIRMPRMTGTDLAISLRSEGTAIPLIFVSGGPAPADMSDPKERFHFIEKPFAAKVLLDAARRFLQSTPVAVAPKVAPIATQAPPLAGNGAERAAGLLLAGHGRGAGPFGFWRRLFVRRSE